MKKMIVLLVIATVVSTRAELKESHIKIYKQADINQDGKVSLEEWTPVVRKRFEEQEKSGWEEQSVKQFNHLDKDDDGFLSLQEFWPEQSKPEVAEEKE